MADRKPAGRWKENEIDVHEYQAMEILVRFWRVTIPRGAVAFSPDQAIYAATWAAGIGPRRRKFMRGKSWWVKKCRTYHEIHEAARALLGKRLVTSQTGREGKPVQRIYVEVADPYDAVGSRSHQRGGYWRQWIRPRRKERARWPWRVG